MTKNANFVGMTAIRRAVFILNPISGTGDKEFIPDIIREEIDSAAFDCRIVQSEYAGHAAEIARRCVSEGVDIVVAVGGDGTVNETARALVHTGTALGIVPCGSGNGLARHLCIPMDIRKAVKTINNCKIEPLDYGVVNGLPFFCTCGMGFDAFISMKFAQAGKRGLKTYVENVLKEWLKYQPETYTVEDGTGERTYQAFLITCANASQYGGNAFIAPRATMTDGLMDVTVMEPFDVFDAAQISFDMFNKTLDKNSKIKTFRTKSIKIHRDAPGAIHYDGDPVMTGEEVDVHIEPKGIRMVINDNVPESAPLPNILLNAFAMLQDNINNMRTDIEMRGRRILTGKIIKR